jgi:hypothetical protein
MRHNPFANRVGSPSPRKAFLGSGFTCKLTGVVNTKTLCENPLIFWKDHKGDITMAEFGQTVVQQFIESKGLKVLKIEEWDEKTPDFEVFKDGQRIFFCEEKSLDYDDFIGEKNDSSYNAISRQLHKAVKQFKSANPNHEIPNVMAFVNLDTLKDMHDLFITITGYSLLESGKYMKIHRVGHRTVDDIEHVDLFLWFDKDRFINYLWKEDSEDETRKQLESVLEGEV